MARKTLTDKGVAALKPRAGRYAFPDPELRGHYVRVTPNGAKSFAAVARAPDGKQLWTTIGTTDALTIETARDRARTILDRVRAGLPAVEPQGRDLRRRRRQLAQAPRRAKRPALARRDRAVAQPAHPPGVARPRIRHDPAQRHHGAARRGRGRARRAAGRLLSQHRALRHELVRGAPRRLRPPIVRGMRRQSPHAQARTRVLADDEIRAIWRAAETTNGTFGALVRICAADRATPRESPRRCAGPTFPTRANGRSRKRPREKDTGGVLAAARRRARDHRGAAPARRQSVCVRGTRRRAVQRLQQVQGSGSTRCCRTARRHGRFTICAAPPARLMSRAGVSSDHAERVMGHAIGGRRRRL